MYNTHSENITMKGTRYSLRTRGTGATVRKGFGYTALFESFSRRRRFERKLKKENPHLSLFFPPPSHGLERKMTRNDRSVGLCFSFFDFNKPAKAFPSAVMINTRVGR